MLNPATHFHNSCLRFCADLGKTITKEDDEARIMGGILSKTGLNYCFFSNVLRQLFDGLTFCQLPYRKRAFGVISNIKLSVIEFLLGSRVL